MNSKTIGSSAVPTEGVASGEGAASVATGDGGSHEASRMTPLQKLKWAVLAKASEWDDKPEPPAYPCPNVDELYEAMEDTDAIYDARSEVRNSGVETKLSAPWSRHYESKAVAKQMPDGSWVGWTYWYGGGKHGEPEAIDWMEDAYDVTCHEEEKLVVVRTFAEAKP